MTSPDEMRRMFQGAMTAPIPPDTTDLDAAVRAGRWRRRRRPASVLASLTVVLVAAGVAVAGPWPAPDRQPLGATPGTPTPTSSTSTSPTAAALALGPGRTVTDASQLIGTWWTEQLAGRDVPDAGHSPLRPLHVKFADDETGTWWSANDGCNESRGRLDVSPAGRFAAEAGVTTSMACLDGTEYPGNPAAVVSADEVRLIQGAESEPQRLVLLRDGEELAILSSRRPETRPTSDNGVTTSAPDGTGSPAADDVPPAQAEFSPVADRLATLAGPHFAGLIVHESERRIVAYWVGEVPAAAAEYAATSPSGITVHINDEARFTRQHLKAAAERIAHSESGQQVGVSLVAAKSDGSGLGISLVADLPTPAQAQALADLAELPKDAITYTWFNPGVPLTAPTS